MKNKTKWIINASAVLLILIIIFVFIKFYKLGLFTSQEAMKKYILSFGALAPLMFVLIQALQVILAPIPGNITGMAGGVMFGTFPGFLLSAAGLIIGSVLAYILAKFYGRKLVYKIAKKEDILKYENKITGDRGLFILFGLFLLPFFPDDALCFIAGLAGIDIRIFLAMVLLGRIPGMYIASAIGNAAISGIDIKTIIICIIYFALIAVAYRYRKQAIAMLNNIGKKKEI